MTGIRSGLSNRMRQRGMRMATRSMMQWPQTSLRTEWWSRFSSSETQTLVVVTNDVTYAVFTLSDDDVVRHTFHGNRLYMALWFSETVWSFSCSRSLLSVRWPFLSASRCTGWCARWWGMVGWKKNNCCNVLLPSKSRRRVGVWETDDDDSVMGCRGKWWQISQTVDDNGVRFAFVYLSVWDTGRQTGEESDNSGMRRSEMWFFLLSFFLCFFTSSLLNWCSTHILTHTQKKKSVGRFCSCSLEKRIHCCWCLQFHDTDRPVKRCPSFSFCEGKRCLPVCLAFLTFFSLSPPPRCGLYAAVVGGWGRRRKRYKRGRKDAAKSEKWGKRKHEVTGGREWFVWLDLMITVYRQTGATCNAFFLFRWIHIQILSIHCTSLLLEKEGILLQPPKKILSIPEKGKSYSFAFFLPVWRRGCRSSQ